jgi:hypothetical protein
VVVFADDSVELLGQLNQQRSVSVSSEHREVIFCFFCRVAGVGAGAGAFNLNGNGSNSLRRVCSSAAFITTYSPAAGRAPRFTPQLWTGCWWVRVVLNPISRGGGERTRARSVGVVSAERVGVAEEGDRPVLKRQAAPAPAVIVPVSPWWTKVRVVGGLFLSIVAGSVNTGAAEVCAEGGKRTSTAYILESGADATTSTLLPNWLG